MIFKDLVNLISSEWQSNKWEQIELETSSKVQILGDKSKLAGTSSVEDFKSEIENITKTTENEEKTNTNEKANIAKDKKKDDGDNGDGGNNGAPKQRESAENEEEEQEEGDDDDFYLFETLQELYRSNESMINNLDHMTKYTKELGNVVSFQSEEINNIISRMAITGHIGGSRESQKMAALASDIVDRIATEMNNYAEKMNPHTISLPEDLNTFLESCRKIFEYQLSLPDQENEKIENAFDTLETFIRSMGGTKNSLESFKESVSEIPALTRKFKKARKRTEDRIGQIVSTIEIGIKKGQVILSELDKVYS
jgi:hypothetical protein